MLSSIAQVHGTYDTAPERSGCLRWTALGNTSTRTRTHARTPGGARISARSALPALSPHSLALVLLTLSVLVPAIPRDDDASLALCGTANAAEAVDLPGHESLAAFLMRDSTLVLLLSDLTLRTSPSMAAVVTACGRNLGATKSSTRTAGGMAWAASFKPPPAGGAATATDIGIVRLMILPVRQATGETPPSWLRQTRAS